MPRRLAPRALAAALTTLALGATVDSAAAHAVPPAEVAKLPASGSFGVHARGNGHGHGMSQYGARGAALQGLGTSAILRFYYPGTHRTVLRHSRVTVRISNATPDTTVFASTPGLRLCTDPAPLRRSGIRYYRLVPSGSEVALQQRPIGKKWRTVRRGLPSGECFAGRRWWVQLRLAGGSSTRFHGQLKAVRSGSGEITVNDVSLDNYTAGVVPREMPASWPVRAVHAQAIAARTYGRYAVEHSAGSSYDICDSTSCQVYGGAAHYSSDGSLLWTDDQDAVVGNENTVLTYHGSAIFAQFSASNGGAVADGGMPYLVAKDDPYDSSASGDPYLSWTSSASVSGVASYYGLKKVTAIEVTRRDGYGKWGGRVVSGYVDGVDGSGKKVRVPTSGYSLGAALGVWTTFFHVDGAS